MEIEFGVRQGSDVRHAVMSSLVQYLQRQSVSVLEVGSYEGQSALVWSAAIAEHCPQGGSVLCVDPWATDYLEKYLVFGHAYGQIHAAFQTGEVYRRFCNNVTFAHSKAPIAHLKGTLSQVLPSICSRRFDVVYIDGDHCASAVRKDLTLTKDLVNAGGLLCGDDLEVQGGDCDLNDVVAVSETTDFWSGLHPGVTVAVWEAFSRVWMRNGVWAVKRTADGAWQIPEGL